MTDRAPRTPNLGNVTAAIERGAYDHALAEIDAALYARRMELQEAVREQVKQIFGENYDIVAPQDHVKLPIPMPLPTDPPETGIVNDDPNPIGEHGIVSRPRPGSEPEAPPVDPLGDNNPEIESRSPLIGPWPQGDDQ